MASTSYEYDFVSGEPPDEYTCPMCTNVARDPYQVGCCGKLFCKTCLDRYRHRQLALDIDQTTLDRTTQCPHCRNEGRFVSFKDARGERSILNLEIYCNNKSNGCTWQGTIREFREHECAFQLVDCTNRCGQTLFRPQLQAHLVMDCTRRRYTCPHCRLEGTYNFISSDTLHLCPNVIITCPNEGCEESFMRRVQEVHFSCCPKKVIQCPYSSVGCQVTFKREDLEGHKVTSTQDHLDLAMGRLIKQQSDMKRDTVVAIEECNGFNESKTTPDFRVSPGGYKMRLSVRFSSNTTHLTLVVTVMREYGSNLEWPCHQVVNVTLLNQLSDTNHYSGTITITQNTAVSGCGVWHNFIAYHGLTGAGFAYFRDNTLYFRVNLSPRQGTKEWLVTTNEN